MHTFYPSNAVYTNGFISLNISDWDCSGRKTWSKLWRLLWYFYFGLVNSMVWWIKFFSLFWNCFCGKLIVDSMHLSRLMDESLLPEQLGFRLTESIFLTLQKTLIFPFKLIICCIYYFLIDSNFAMLSHISMLSTYTFL